MDSQFSRLNIFHTFICHLSKLFIRFKSWSWACVATEGGNRNNRWMLELFLRRNVILMKPLFKKNKKNLTAALAVGAASEAALMHSSTQSRAAEGGQDPPATSNRTIGCLKSSVRIAPGPHASLSRWYRKIGSPLGECITTSCVQTCHDQKARK